MDSEQLRDCIIEFYNDTSQPEKETKSDLIWLVEEIGILIDMLDT